jgi:tetratricopeptide (TPR) repeat protein
MLARVLWIAVALLGLAVPVPRALAACKLVKRFELPVTMSGPRPMVHGKINGTDVLLVADSGAFWSFITPAAAAELKLRLEPAPQWLSITGVGGAPRTWLTHVDTFTLVTLTVPKLEFLVAGNDVGGGAVGLLGQNVFRLAGDVEYDLANGVIRLFREEGCSKSALAYWAGDRPYSVMDIEHATAAAPHTTGTAFLNGARIRVVFDTGAASSMLTLDAAKRAGVTPQTPGVVPAGIGYGMGRQQVESWIAPFASFKIGEEEIRNTHLRVGATRMLDDDMLVGADFFLSHRIYVANEQSKLYFTYNGGPVFDLTRTVPASPTPGTDTGGPGDGAAGGGSAAKGSLEAPGGEGAAAAAGIASARSAPQQPARVAAGNEPTDAAGFSRRGSAFAARLDFVHAIADLTRACELAPTEASYFFQRGQAYWGNRQLDLALADFDHALKLKPDDPSMLVARAALHAERHEKPAALADLDAADRTAPKSTEMRFYMGELYLNADQFAAAVVQYTDWIGTHLRDDAHMPDASNARCWARAQWGQELAQALSDCDLALKLRPDTAGYLDSRGLVRLRRAEYDQAITDYTRALKLQPDLAWSLYGRGVAELRKGMKDRGQADIDAALKLQPHIAEDASRHNVGP